MASLFVRVLLHQIYAHVDGPQVEDGGATGNEDQVRTRPPARAGRLGMRGGVDDDQIRTASELPLPAAAPCVSSVF